MLGQGLGHWGNREQVHGLGMLSNLRSPFGSPTNYMGGQVSVRISGPGGEGRNEVGKNVIREVIESMFCQKEQRGKAFSLVWDTIPPFSLSTSRSSPRSFGSFLGIFFVVYCDSRFLRERTHDRFVLFVLVHFQNFGYPALD